MFDLWSAAREGVMQRKKVGEDLKVPEGFSNHVGLVSIVISVNSESAFEDCAVKLIKNVADNHDMHCFFDGLSVNRSKYL